MEAAKRLCEEAKKYLMRDLPPWRIWTWYERYILDDPHCLEYPFIQAIKAYEAETVTNEARLKVLSLNLERYCATANIGELIPRTILSEMAEALHMAGAYQKE